MAGLLDTDDAEVAQIEALSFDEKAFRVRNLALAFPATLGSEPGGCLVLPAGTIRPG